jgi:hypothetical protein
MQRKDLYLLAIIWIAALVVFFPLFNADYLFMDEALQIWGYKSTPGFYMLIDEGRFLTEWLEGWLFKTFVTTTRDIAWLRIISLVGWLACLPIWYQVVKRLVANVPAYSYLPFFTCLYLVTSLPFIVSVQWATCLQFFIADTASLLAGSLFLHGLRFDGKRMPLPVGPAIASILLGVTALFFYQGAFACFLIPFLIYFIHPATPQKELTLGAGIFWYFVVCGLYFLLYKLSFRVFFTDIPIDPRNGLYFDPIGKLKFFLARPLERSFRFTILTNEDSTVSKYYYPLALVAWVVAAFVRFGKANWLQAVKYLAGAGFVFLISYLPALMIQDSFASNRTLLALNICVFVVMLEMLLFFIKSRVVLQAAGVAVALIFVISARYNFQTGFLRPVQQETAAVKSYIRQHFNNSIHTIYYIRPSEELVEERFHVHKSMDEFGVPSSCWEWVPDPFVRQMVYEATGNRDQARRLTVKHWPDRDSFRHSGAVVDSNTLVVDATPLIHP